MHIQRIEALAKVTNIEPLKINGEEFSAEFIKSTIYARIWRSAVVVKNKRESDKGGSKATIQQALANDLITKEEAFDLLITGDKAKIASLREQLPQTAKSEDPSDDDIKVAIGQVMANKGQAS